MNRSTTQYHDNLQLNIISPSTPPTQYSHIKSQMSGEWRETPQEHGMPLHPSYFSNRVTDTYIRPLSQMLWPSFLIRKDPWLNFVIVHS